MPITKHKMIDPTYCLLYLELLVNFRDQVIYIPQDKRDICIKLIEKMLKTYRSCSNILIKTVQSLAGHLNFLCQAVPTGKTFLSSLFMLIAPQHGEIVQPGHHRHLNREIHHNLLMWHGFIDEISPAVHQLVPFLVCKGLVADQIQLFVDSAGTSHLGMGCIYGNHRAQGLWQDMTLFAGGRCPNITLLELLAIVIALEIWAPWLKGSAIKLRFDNQATAGWLTQKHSNIPVAMHLL